jgi:hypothetical protein
VNLPGPFRVGISSKGRISAGMNVGPLSVSTGVGASARKAGSGVVQAQATLAQAVAEIEAEGWRVVAQDSYAVILRKGRRQLQLRQVAPDVVEASPSTTRTALIVWGIVLVLGFWLAASILN